MNLLLSTPSCERVQDLLSRLTLDEKVAMMNHSAQGVPRLNIPAYNYWNEAPHRVGRNGRATVFLQAIEDYKRFFEYQWEQAIPLSE